MRVALVVERFTRSGGGVEQVAWNVARQLVHAGDDVEIFAREGEPLEGTRLRRLPVSRTWQPLRVMRFATAVRSALQSGTYDATHSFSRTLGQDVFHAGSGSHADYMQAAYGARGTTLRRLSPRHALLLSLDRRIFSDPRIQIQCVSEMVKREIATRFAVPDARLRVIHGGVDCERFAPGRHAAERKKMRAREGSGNATVWLLAGSGWWRKGLDTALAALARLGDSTTQLWVAGRDAPAPWKGRARRLGVADRVRFLGARDDLESVYAAADGLFLPTRYDPFGQVCLEAAASGRPIVTSTSAGAAEILGGASIVIERADDVAAFANALAELADPGRRAALGEAGRRIAERFAWSRQVEKLRALYLETSR